VVGRRKFLYDLWGDTVTIARRLAGGEGAAIRVTTALRDRLGEQFVFRGPIKLGADGKSGADAWEVTG
jgi:adenylate cyclase